jgi:hypothetical protein
LTDTIRSIQNRINELASKIHAPHSLTTIFSSSPQDGRPHVELQGGEYRLVFEERGNVFSVKKTRELDTLLYWIFCSITSKMSQEFELHHRNLTQDPRRIIFAKQLELMKKISQDWHCLLKGEIDELLSENPYHD